MPHRKQAHTTAMTLLRSDRDEVRVRRTWDDTVMDGYTDDRGIVRHVADGAAFAEGPYEVIEDEA